MKECRPATHGAYVATHTHTHTLVTLSDWLSPSTNFLPLITIKLVTLVSMRNKHTRAGLRMARLFIVAALTKEPPITRAYGQPDL